MAGSKDLERARAWLRRNGLGDIEPTPLIAERLAALRRSDFYAIVIGLFVFLATLTASRVVYQRPRGDVGPEATHIRDLVAFIVFSIAMLLGAGLAMWLRRRAVRSLERRSTRTAHATAADAIGVLGRRYAVVVAMTYVGGSLLGVGVAVFADQPRDRAFGYVFMAGVLALAVLSAVVLRGVLRRPALAEDAESLLLDDVLRTADAQRAAIPYPMAFAFFGVLAGTVGSWPVWAYLGFAVAVGIAYALVTDWPAAAPKAEVAR